MSYTKTNWENLPSTNTPVNASNLNKIENELDILEKNTTYSTTEQRIGTWIDGKPIYRKVYSNITVAQNGSVIIDSNITTSIINTLVDIKGTILKADGNYVPIIYTSRLGNQYQISMSIDGNYGLRVVAGSSSENLTKGTIILEYTKTTD